VFVFPLVHAIFQEAKVKLGDHMGRVKELQTENEKLTAGLKILTAQVV
jgi:hypothetical protein